MPFVDEEGEWSTDPAVRPIVECSIGVSPGQEGIVLQYTSFVYINAS